MSTNLRLTTANAFQAPAAPHHGLTGTLRPQSAVRRIEAGRNVMAQVMPDRRLVRVTNFQDEGLDGLARTNRFGNHPNYHRFHPYDARAVACLPDGSVCAVRESLAEEARANLRYLQDIGIAGAVQILGLPEPEANLPLMQLAHHNAAFMRSALGAMGANPALVPYIGSDNTNELAAMLGLTSTAANVGAVNDWNNKGLTAQRFEAAGLAVPPGVWLNDGYTNPAPLEAAYHALVSEHPGKSIFVSLAIASSGAGVFEVEHSGQMNAILTNPNVLWQLATPGVGVRLSVEVPDDILLNWMVWLDDDPNKHRLLSASRQIMLKKNPHDKRGTAHAGNVALERNLWPVALQNVNPAVQVMWENGMRGFVGVDEVVDLNAGVSHMIEVNARMNGNNGGGFPAIAAGPLQSWAAHNKLVVPRGLTLQQYQGHLANHGAAYSPNTGYGVFVINSATARNGAMQIGVRAADAEHAQSLLERAKWTS